jgi:uncharacterized membrane protein HdeD (DUF308 family)
MGATIMSHQSAPLVPTLSLLLHGLARNWWLFLIRGIAGILFGVLAFAWPGVTLLTLVLFYGAFALIDGASALCAAVMGGVTPAPRWWLAVVGVAGLLAGLLTFVWPGLTALILLFFIAGWSIAIGVFQIIGAIELRKHVDNEWMLILSGALALLFGVVLFMRPGEGALALIWLIGVYAILFGVLNIAFALRLRGHR